MYHVAIQTDKGLSSFNIPDDNLAIEIGSELELATEHGAKIIWFHVDHREA